MQHNRRSISGVQIENTLSMALQSGRRPGRILPLLLIALVGCFSGIFTFLSMFQPPFHSSVLVICIAASFGLFSWFALSAKRLLPVRILLFLLYGVLLIYLRSPFWNGFIHLVNQVYKQIFFTDWNYFTVDETLSESFCVTVFLAFLLVPLLCLLCYAVLRFQNFYLALLATFPHVCVGFFFGIAADHLWAFLLTAFWCSMAAIHLSNFGSAGSSSQSSFWRRDNTFFPVTGMRFMVTERIGLAVLVLVFGLLLGADVLLNACKYERSETVKQLRGRVQTITSEVMAGASLFDAFQNNSGWKNPTASSTQLKLGEEDEREFENVIISEAIFTELPESRVYLKRYTGHVYDGRTWNTLPDYCYEDRIFSTFQKAHFYPQEFLFPAAYMLMHSQTTMTLQTEEEVIGKCLPYGFRTHDAITCIRDNSAEIGTNSFTIFAGPDFEILFAQEGATGTRLYGEIPATSSFKSTVSLDPRDEVTLVAPDKSQNLNTLSAALFCADGYRDFVYKYYLQLPDASTLQAVEQQYGFLLSQYDAQTATAAETIAFLQSVRSYMCNSVVYSLAPGKTPADVDYVSYFLLQNRKGYCAHYATAGTILARMAGIPARYCDGYVLDCQSDRAVRITNGSTHSYSLQILDSNAHSWVEIYLDGVGWIPFEFTFSYYTPPPEVETTEAPTTEMPPTETIAAAVTETLPAATTEAVSAETTTTRTEPAGLVVQAVNPLPFLICLGVLLLLAGIALLLVWLRRRAIAKRRAGLSQEDTQAAARYAYQLLMRLIAYKRLSTTWNTSEELTKLLQQAVPQLSGTAAAEIVGILTRLRFSPHPLSREDLHCLVQLERRMANAIYQKAGFWEKLLLLWIYHFI